MEKDNPKLLELDYLSGTLSDSDLVKFNRFLKENPDYQDQVRESVFVWNQLDRLEKPVASKQLDEQFFNMLSEKTRKRKDTILDISHILKTFLGKLWRPEPAYRLAFLSAGLLIGYYINMNRSIDSKLDIDRDTIEIRQKLVLTLLEQPSATKRLQGVGEANKVGKVNEIIIDALLETLNNDSNVNVRLAAIESLTKFADNALVREGLVQAIAQQEFPVVQITLANLMVALQEKKSIEPFKRLIRTKELDESVKQNLENSILQII